MLKLFQSTDTLFATNGDKIIQARKAKVHKEDNGAYYLDVETGLEYAEDLVEGAIIVAPTPQGEQAFRITNPQKSRKKITVKAYHLFYDTQNYLILDSYVVEKNCNDALAHLNAATDSPSPFTTLSNISTVDSYRCVRTSLYEAIQTVIERWGGHLVRDNWSIKVLASIGQDNGVTVRYAKNLKDISCVENWDKVVTKLLPTGYDGIMLNDLDGSIDPFVYAPIEYDIPYTKTVAFEQDIDQFKDESGQIDQAALINDLRQQAQNYINTYCYPEINYTLKANIEKITDIGDTIEVIDERLKLNLLTNIIAFDYDCILGKYTELEFGNFKPKLSNLIGNITADVTHTVGEWVEQKQDNLISGENIKTINSESILGRGNVNVGGTELTGLEYSADGKIDLKFGDDTKHTNIKVKAKNGNTYLDIQELFEHLINELAGKQNALTFDTVPTSGSDNPVTSAGIKDYVDTAVQTALQGLNSGGGAQ